MLAVWAHEGEPVWNLRLVDEGEPLTRVRPSAAILYQATSAGLDTDPLIKGFLGGYCVSAAWLAYNVFVTGMQTTPLSQATVGVVFPIVIYLNYAALGEGGKSD